MVCLVTNRARLCGASVPFDVARQRLAEQADEAIRAGVDLIQIRERDLEARPLAQLVGDFVSRARGTATRVVVNDRLDVALAAGADGVHLRHDSVATADVRRMVPPSFLIGRSVHGVGDAIEAGRAADYLIAGTVFASESKPGTRPLLGTAGLRVIVAAVRVPVLAIGGITDDRIEEIARSGASGLAAIGLFVQHRPVGGIVGAWRLRFDSVKSPS